MGTAQGAEPAASTTAIASPAASPGDDPTVKAWKEKITKQAKAAGDNAPVFTSAEYVIDPERLPRKPKGEVTPLVSTAYPSSGCTLQMVAYHDKSTSPSYMRASSLTSCLRDAGTIKHYVSLSRFDFWGWNRRAWNERTVYNTDYLALTVSNRCSDANYNVWNGYVRGDLWRAGYYYYATSYHEVGKYCGGS